MLGLGRSVRDVSQRLLQNVALRCQQVKCLRIGNAEIPNHKRLETSLQYIHGIGRNRAHQMLVDLSIQNKLTKDLTGVELNSLKEEVSRYLTGGDLKRCVSADVQKLIDSGCYRGIRHIDMLPCRGQRTKTNARTRKEHSKQLGKVPNSR
ncbi:Small ribosomal subunit protein S13, mitochondrial [Linum grandiflorum]